MNNPRLSPLATIALFSLGALASPGCSKQGTSIDTVIVGTWYSDSGMYQNQFNADGTGQITPVGLGSPEPSIFKWHVEGNKLCISKLIKAPNTWDYETKESYKIFNYRTADGKEYPVKLDLTGENGNHYLSRPAPVNVGF